MILRTSSVFLLSNSLVVGLDIQSQERLGIRGAEVEPEVVVFDRQTVEPVLPAVFECLRDCVDVLS